MHFPDTILTSSIEKNILTWFFGQQQASVISVVVHNTHTNIKYKCPDPVTVQVLKMLIFKDSCWVLLTMKHWQVNPIEGSGAVGAVAETVSKLYEGTLGSKPSMAYLLEANQIDRAIQMMSIIVKQVAIVTEDTEQAKQFKKDFSVRVLQDLMKVVYIVKIISNKSCWLLSLDFAVYNRIAYFLIFFYNHL